jgi:GTP-binding protein
MKIESARFLLSAVREADFIRNGRGQVAFVGRSNVGKSSLLNRLLGRKALARISSTPGRTRAVNYFLINDALYFVDLPGYGYARVGKQERRSWAKLMEAYLRQAADSAMVVQIVDAKVGATELDLQAWDYLVSLGYEPLVAATKTDRLGQSKLKRAMDDIRRQLGVSEPGAVVPFSARSGAGVKELWSRIDQFLKPGLESSSLGGIKNG